MDLPAIMKQLSRHDILTVHTQFRQLMFSITDTRYLRLQETLFGTGFRTTLLSTPPVDLVNEFIKRWITKHQNPTWEALVDLFRALGALGHGAAERIEAIIPTVSPPTSEQAALKKKD